MSSRGQAREATTMRKHMESAVHTRSWSWPCNDEDAFVPTWPWQDIRADMHGMQLVPT